MQHLVRMEERTGTADPTPMRPLRLVPSIHSAASRQDRLYASPHPVAQAVGSRLPQVVPRSPAPAVHGAVDAARSAPQAPLEGVASKARGILLGGRYRIEAHLGDGGMGSVYRAFDEKRQETVAVKVLKPRLGESQDRIARFRQEARALRLLKHPNSVRIFDSGRTPQGTLYFVMEYLEGYNLADMLEDRGPLTWQSAFKICTQILRALREAHELGIIHRDLKPENIYLCRARKEGCHFVKVLDFGLAKVTDPGFGSGPSIESAVRTQTGYVFGTPRYMSPEQARSQPLDGRSDLYNVGLLLYQMMTGTPTYCDEDAIVVMAKHVRTRPELPSKRKPGLVVPKRAEAIVMQALEKRPERRFSSADTMLSALESCLQRDLTQVVAPAEQPRRSGASWLLAAFPFLALLGVAAPLAQVEHPAAFGEVAYGEMATQRDTRLEPGTIIEGSKKPAQRRASHRATQQPDKAIHAHTVSPPAAGVNVGGGSSGQSDRGEHTVTRSRRTRSADAAVTRNKQQAAQAAGRRSRSRTDAQADAALTWPPTAYAGQANAIKGTSTAPVWRKTQREAHK